MTKQTIEAARNMDWMQVVLNGGPPCFHICDDGHFCGRAEAWDGHKTFSEKEPALHEFVSLAALLSNNEHLDEDKAVIQCDVVGWKVIAPDGRVIHKLDILQATAALMSWNQPNSTPWGKNWWPDRK